MLWQRITTSIPTDDSSDPPRLLHPGPRAVLSLPGSALPTEGWLVFLAEFDEAGVVDLLVEFRFQNGTQSFLRPTVTGRNTFYGAFRSAMGLDSVVVHAVGSGTLEPRSIYLTRQSAARQAVPVLTRAVRLLLRNPDRLLSSATWFFHRLLETKAVHLPPERPHVPASQIYHRWIEFFDERPDMDRALHEARLHLLSRRPPISILVLLDSISELPAALAEVKNQIYPHWQLVAVLPQPGSGRAPVEIPPEAKLTIVHSDAEDRGARLNAALASVEGEVALVLPKDGQLRSHALLECALAFEAEPQMRILYADEDVRMPDGRRSSPRFKVAWSPHAAASRDTMGDPTFYATTCLREVGGWREGLDGAESHDLKLRVAEHVGPSAIVHLSKILFHRHHTEGRADPGRPLRSAPVAVDHLARLGISAEVVTDVRSPFPRVIRRWPDPPLVSIVIPTRDRAALLRTCLESILTKTSYPAFEIIVVDNDSEEPETHALYRELERDSRVRILDHPGPFNYSAINNAAVRAARGSVVALVNNDIEVVSEDWLGEMVGYVLEERVGCVGAKLYYPDGTVQHGSVVVGLSGGAGHIHKHADRTSGGYLDRLVTVQNVSAVTAACLVVRKSVYEEVGGLDETLFKVAFNDVDFCLKVAAAGYFNVWTPFAELIHHESVSRGNDLKDRAKARRFASELAALQERWGRRLIFDPYFSPHLDWHSEEGGIRFY